MGATGYIIKGHNGGRGGEARKEVVVSAADGTIDVEKVETFDKVDFRIKTTYDGYETIHVGSPASGGYFKAAHIKFNEENRRYRLVCILNGGSYTPVAKDFAIYYIKFGWRTGGVNADHWYIEEYSRRGNGAYVSLEQIALNEYNVLIHTPTGYAYANIGILKEDKETDVTIDHFNNNTTRYTPTGTIIETETPAWKNGAPAISSLISSVESPVVGQLGYYNGDRNLYYFDGTNWINVYSLVETNPEDLTTINGLLQLADRSSVNGLGYVILRPDKTFAEQVVYTNTIYEVRYNFDLDVASVTIPAGCTLKFDGGSIINGTLSFNQTKLEGRNVKIYSSITGTILGSAYIDWFCETSNISLRLGELADCCKTILFYPKDYSINNFTKINGEVSLIGDNKKTNIHLISPTDPIISGTRTVYACLCLGSTREWVGSVRDITFTIDANTNPITDPIHIGKMHDCLFCNCEFIQIGGYKNAFLCRKNDVIFSSFSGESYNVIIDTCIFRQAIIEGESNESIGFLKTNNVLVTNCQFYKMTDDLGFHRCHDLTICNNYLDAYDGRITTNNCWNVKIYSNTIEYNYGQFGQGIFADYEYATTDNELNNYQIYNNTIDFSKAADTDTYGIRIECVTNAYIHDNVIIPKKKGDGTFCKTSITIDYYTTHNKTYISDIHIFNNLVGSIRIDNNLEGGSNFCIKNNTLTGELYIPELLNATIYENYILGYKVAGTTLERPQYGLLETKKSFAGNSYFDTDLGKPIFWSGLKWVDADGNDLQ